MWQPPYTSGAWWSKIEHINIIEVVQIMTLKYLITGLCIVPN